MPDTYIFTGKDGIERSFVGDHPPTDEELAQIEHAEAPAPKRGGLRRPMTSLVAPELEGAREKVNTALVTPHGTPIMARSRTGALYPSETGTGAANAAKSFGRGFAGGMIDQAEGVTSPIGIAGEALAAVPKPPLLNGAATVIENIPLKKNVVPFADAAAGRLRTVAQAAQDASMGGVTRGADMYQMERFPRSTESTARVPMAHGEPSANALPVREDGLPMVRKADVQPRATPSLRTRYPNGLPIDNPAVAPIEPVASHVQPVNEADVDAWVAKRMKVLMPERPPMETPGRGMQPDNILDIEPESMDVGRTQAADTASALSRERMDIGAEKVGRANGMTKQDVRTQAGPVLSEPVGEASPILPEKALQRMADTMKAMKPEERAAYVMKAADLKTQAQLENMRRLMAHFGLAIPLAASIEPSVRDMLLQRMRAGVTGRETAQ